MQQYLQSLEEPKVYRDAADYGTDSEPFQAPDGFQWIKGIPHAESTPYIEKTMKDKLLNVFMAQPVELRAQFYTLKVAVQNALENKDMEAAKAIIEGAPIPDALKPLQKQLLEYF